MKSRSPLAVAAGRPPLGGSAVRWRPFSLAVNSATTTCLAVLAVALAATLPFLSTLDAYFASDDFGLIWLFSNKLTYHVLTLFTRAWTEGIYGIQPDELRPMLALSYQLDSLWGAANPIGYHASSIVLHVLNSLLVFGIARLAARVSLPAATFAGILFAVLPVHAEPVGWISGRADSIPALFYLSCFLAYALWRRTGRGWFYAAALAAELLGLYSKQSAIMMLPTLLAYDLLVERRPIRLSRAWLRPYLPFAGLVFGYLGLRFALFGNAVREQSVTSAMLVAFADRQASYLKMLALGSSLYGADRTPPELALLGKLTTWVAIVAAALLVAREVRRVQAGSAVSWDSGALGRLLFFGPLWWLILIAPLAVTYESARHLYQPSAGVAVALGIVFDLLWARARPSTSAGRAWRFGAVGAATVLVVASTLMLQRPIEQWNRSAAVSETIVRDLERELRGAPAGSLVMVGAPVVGSSTSIHTWVWMWAMPFATLPPFLEAGLAERVHLVEPPDVYCCPRDQWFARTRAALAAWAARPERPPVVVLRWNAWSGALERSTDADDPRLREVVEQMLAARTQVELCGLFDHLLGTIGGTCDAPPP